MSWLCCNKCQRNTTEDVRSLDYSHSLLQEVPAEVYMYERTLEKLYLDSNRILELPKQLFNCDELRVLNLSDNEINFLPPAVSLLINLQNLDISKNAVTKIPENVRNCSCLSVLNLSINPLEKFPESLINLISLKELYLTDIYLEFLPANFGKLVNLKILELRENNLSTLPRTMSRLVHLTRLDIGNNEFTELPEVVSTLYNITELWVDGNHIRKLYPSIGQLRKVMHFEASNNKIDFLPSEIGYWTKLIEFSISNNEISQLPPSIGNMKNLVSLKLDDNQLRILPDAVGKLVNLEELMINYNCINHLPASIGLLRKLQVLIADRNKLTSIPSELGSCSSLSILSLRDNRITDIPAEIGHLFSLRVLNLVSNQLRYLPVSLLKLNKLSALWLSNNQSQPLVPLQQEINNETYQLVLTCFMLPQLSHKRTEYPVETTYSIPSHAHDKHICFASDASVLVEQPRRLSRAPTPYPKELRALAKHAKNIQRGLTTSHQISEGIRSVQDSLQIKEAKVAITATNTPLNGTHVKINNADNTSSDTCSVTPNTNSSTQQTVDTHSFTTPDIKTFVSKEYSVEDCALSLPVFTVKNSPVIRKAKNIRTDAQNPDISKITVTKKLSQDSCKTELNKDVLQPPPYHIAAARSLQSQYFNSFDCTECVSLTSLNQIPSLTSYVDKKTIDNNYSERVIMNIDNNVNHEYEKDLVQPEMLSNNANIQNCNYENDTDNNSKKYNYNSFDNRDKSEYNKNNFCSNIQNQNEYKPRTFIQDKPAPSEHIVAPTPKRLIHTDNTVLPFFIDVNNTNKKVPVPSSEHVNNMSSIMHPIQHISGEETQTMITCKDVTRKTDSTSNDNPTVMPSNSTMKWAFGKHKNATVIPVTIQKNSDLGFTISEKHGHGIFIDSIVSNGPASHILKVGDKILEVDGIDFTDINEARAINVLQSSSTFINMMISHMD